ncbi:MAG: hypothetical protein M3N08_08115 [Pseudomonadota bacterium]|nr:hypothetical protein [Pseudomonadota bacterium]
MAATIPMQLINGVYEVVPEAMTTGLELATVGGESAVAAAIEGGLGAGGAVGVAGGFEIPVWGWIATGVAVVGGAGYGVYKHYQNKHEADAAAQKQGFKDSAEALDTAKAGFKNSGELHFVDEQIKKAGLGNDLHDYAQKHGHNSLEDFMKTSGHKTGHDYALSWGYQTPAEREAAKHKQPEAGAGTSPTAPINHPAASAHAPSRDEILRVQQAVGLDEAHQTGKWDNTTNDAVQRLIIQAQRTEAYANAGGTVEGKYGPKTELGLTALVKDGKISAEAADALKAVGAAKLHQVYRPPHDVEAIIAQVQPEHHRAFVPPAVTPVTQQAKVEIEAPPISPAVAPISPIANIGIPLSPLPPSINRPNYRSSFGNNLANDGTGKIDGSALQNEGPAKVRQWDANGMHMAVVDVKDHGKHIVDTSVTSAEGTRTTHTVNGKMQWSVVNLKQTDGSVVVASNQQRDPKGKLVEQATAAAGTSVAASRFTAPRVGM